MKKGYVFGNDNRMDHDSNLVVMPIYMIMFV